MSEVKGNDKKAVALRYQAFEPAPKMVAKGDGLVAEEIIRRAQEHGIFVHDSSELVSLLSQIELNDYVPQSLWEVVAELLVWVRSIEVSR